MAEDQLTTHKSICYTSMQKKGIGWEGGKYKERSKKEEDVLMNMYFSDIVKDEKIGLVKMDFDSLDVEMLYNSLTISPINVNLVSNHFFNNIFPISLQSNFTFRLFPFQIKDITSCLFVAQALTE